MLISVCTQQVLPLLGLHKKHSGAWTPRVVDDWSKLKLSVKEIRVFSLRSVELGVGISRGSLVLMEALALRLQQVGDPERGADPVPGA